MRPSRSRWRGRRSRWVGEDAGSKLAKARELDIEVLDEAAFLKRVGQPTP